MGVSTISDNSCQVDRLPGPHRNGKGDGASQVAPRKPSEPLWMPGARNYVQKACTPESPPFLGSGCSLSRARQLGRGRVMGDVVLPHEPAPVPQTLKPEASNA